MNELQFERKSSVEKDIADLILKIGHERINLKTVGITGCHNTQIQREIYNNKDYSDYRKLIDSLKKLTRMYNQLLQQYQINAKTFYSDMTNNVNKEINNCHEIMVNSLDRNNNEQYRCLNDSYIKLMELVRDIDRSDNDTYSFKDGKMTITKNESPITEDIYYIPLHKSLNLIYEVPVDSSVKDTINTIMSIAKISENMITNNIPGNYMTPMMFRMSKDDSILDFLKKVLSFYDNKFFIVDNKIRFY